MRLAAGAKDAVEIGGDQPQRAVTAARQLQQRGVGVGGALAAQLRLQRLRQGLADGQALPGQTPLQQVQRGVELVAFVGFVFDGVARGADEAVDPSTNPLKPGSPAG